MGEPAVVLSSGNQPWSLPRKCIFRFFCAYFVLYILPFPLDEMARLEWMARYYISGPTTTMQQPLLGQLSEKYRDAWNEIVPWVGANILHLSHPITIRPNGSGDTTWNYVQVFWFAVLALGVSLVWSFIDRRPTDYARLRDWLRVYVRFYLAWQMLVYGAIKVVPRQFPKPALDRLVQPFGDASPMGLLWTFIGASPAYEIFSGAAEMLGGLLLTTRRTTLLGALVSAAAMIQVAALNFCYDVPVKLFSSHLLLMALWLMAPDIPRLVRVVILHRGVAPAPVRPLTPWRWLNWLLVAVRTLLVGGFVYLQLNMSLRPDPPKPPLYGVWNVERFVWDGVEQPPLTTNNDRWRRFIVDYPGLAAVQLTNASRVRYRVQYDPEHGTMTLSRTDFTDWKASFHVSRTDESHLELDGTFDGHSLKVTLQQENLDEFFAQFRLMNRGFHWVNEYPFNR